MSNQTPLFTKTLTSADSPFTIIEDDGIAKWSLETVTGPCTLEGTMKIRSLASGPITIAEGKTVSDTSQSARCCLTLTIPEGSTVIFMASQT
ncbi:MAG: hypothetical protein PHT69_02040 [Bacteroidales bacterium]|nr:hypothetical protein [Bacteroidales bacterium]